jgi:malate synthase
LGEFGTGRLEEAAEILDKLILTDDFVEFLTLIAYDYLA